MTRYERNQYFRRLCELRDAYRTRGAADRRTAMTIAQAIVAAEQVMAAQAAAASEQPPSA